MKAVNPTDTWDWPFLYYVGTVLLNMLPPRFWKCSPRKLNSLLQVYIELNNTDDKSKKTKTGYIDQLF